MHLDMLEDYLMPQLEQDMARDLIFQQDDTPPTLPSQSHRISFSCGICLDWMRLTNNMATTVTSPCASGLLPVWIRERRLRYLLPRTLHELRARITDALAQVDTDMLGSCGMKQLTGGTSAEWYEEATSSSCEWNLIISYHWILLVVAFFVLFWSY
jgi:hypothetical protein